MRQDGLILLVLLGSSIFMQLYIPPKFIHHDGSDWRVVLCTYECVQSARPDDCIQLRGNATCSPNFTRNVIGMGV